MTLNQNGFFSSELGLRIISALVLVAIVFVLSWMGGLPFTIMSVILSALLFYEWQSIVRQSDFDGPEAMLTLGFAALLASIVFGGFAYVLAGFLILGLLLELVSTGPEKSDVRWIGLGALYCAIPAFALPVIRETGLALILFVFLIVWATDVIAYFAGRQFGGPKLLPMVSPKKTWSGAAGGVVGALIIAFLFHQFVPGFDSVSTWLWAILLSVISQAGDLFESAIKRHFDVKDSSQLIPGHGGFLDRVDGLVAAALPVAAFIALG